MIPLIEWIASGLLGLFLIAAYWPKRDRELNLLNVFLGIIFGPIALLIVLLMLMSQCVIWRSKKDRDD